MRLFDIMTAPWAITGDVLTEIQMVYEAHMKGEKIDLKALEARMGFSFQTMGQLEYEIINGKAYFELTGPLTPDLGFFAMLFGGSSTKQFNESLNKAKNDPAVTDALVRIGSPGGLVEGMFESAEAVADFNKVKPIDFISDGVVASAAYLIASQGRNIYMTSNSVRAGNIGAIINHKNYSQALKAEGVEFIEIASGDFKGTGSPNRAMTEKEKAFIKEDIMAVATMFFEAVSIGRGISVDAVREMEGAIYRGQKAIEVGLVDGVSTIDDLLTSKASAKTSGAKTVARSGVDVSAKIKTNLEEMNMNEDQLKAAHPDLYTGIIAKAQEGLVSAVDVKTKVEASAQGERARILALDALIKSGREKMIAEFKADGSTTAETAAIQILAFEDEKLAGKAKAIVADAAEVAAVTQSEPGKKTPVVASTVDDAAPLEERCKAVWDGDKDLRAEFSGDYESYMSFMEADEAGQVRILGKKG